MDNPIEDAKRGQISDKALLKSEGLWYAIGERKWKTLKALIEETWTWKFRWFKTSKADRALDFEWTEVIKGADLSNEKYHGLILMRRSWDSLKAKVPEKANAKRLGLLKESAGKETQ